jgi:hypothetical protein
MTKEDVARELNKIEEALRWAEEHFIKQSEANAALHMNNRVLYSPIAVAVTNARESLRKVFDELVLSNQ